MSLENHKVAITANSMKLRLSLEANSSITIFKIITAYYIFLENTFCNFSLQHKYRITKIIQKHH